MPKSVKHHAGNITLLIILVLAVVGIIIVVLLYIWGVIKLPGKPTPTSPKASNVQVELETKYENPFDKSTQYQNPFSEYQNPFDQLK